MRLYRVLGCIGGLLSLLACSAAQTTQVENTPNATLSHVSSPPAMPTSEKWLTHVQHDIAPFYMQAAAMGEPKGNYPTFRCNDGTTLNPHSICPELTETWIAEKLGRQYTRMLSRQIYSYGVIFHMTGDTAALAAAKAGIDYLKTHLLDKQGGAITYLLANGKAGFDAKQRTSQDLAYAQIGMAFYYYLTRDPAVLRDIMALKNYIFTHYRSQTHDQLLWVLADSEEQSATQLELVSQLDQINAYMLIMIPLLPDAEATKWKNDLRWLITNLLSHYHDEEEQRFYGFIHHPEGKKVIARHADNGHTMKAYWVMYLSARILNDAQLEKQAEQGMRAVLARAYDHAYLHEILFDTDGLDPNMQVSFWNARKGNRGSMWWEHAELNQAAETLAFKDPSMTKYLRYTYATWMETMVDKQHGGILSYIYGQHDAKLNHWKNGYHGTEHALVGYLGAAQREKKAATLYFAINPLSNQHTFTPYYFTAKHMNVTPSQGVQTVTFSHIY